MIWFLVGNGKSIPSENADAHPHLSERRVNEGEARATPWVLIAVQYCHSSLVEAVPISCHLRPVTITYHLSPNGFRSLGPTELLCGSRSSGAKVKAVAVVEQQLRLVDYSETPESQ
jgi:hypothetical protein